MTHAIDEPDDAPGAEPTLDAMMRMLGQPSDRALGGWRDLDEAALNREFLEIQRRRDAALKHEANLFRDVFWLNPQGRQVLEILMDLTLRRRTWPNALLINPHALMAEGIWREAENSFVAAILAAIAQAQGVEQARRSET